MRNRCIFGLLAFLVICTFGFIPAQARAAGTVTVIPAFSPEYNVLDKIQPGDLATKWTIREFSPIFLISSHSELVSPFDGSTAIMQYVVSPQGYTSLSRNYSLGQSYSPGAKVALFTQFVLAPTDVEATVITTFFSGTNQVGRLSAGYSTWDNPWDLVLPPNHSGLIQFDTTGFSGSFDNFNIEVSNVSFGAQSGAVFDEIRFLPPGGGGSTDLNFTISSPLLLIGKDEQSSGILFKATTSAPETVNFKIGSTLLESVPTVPKDGKNVAETIWWGRDATGKTFPDGLHDVDATVRSQTITKNIGIQRIPSLLITFAISPFSKDPTSSILPPPPSCFNCLTDFTDEMGKKQSGFVSGVLVGDPVNIVSGNYSLPKIDLRLKSRISLVLSRVYNSLDKNSGPFGRGWSSLFFTKLENTSATPTLKLSDGSKVLFTKQGSNYVSEPAYGLQLSYSDATTLWLLTNPQGSEWHFDSAGRIIRMASACCGRGAADALTFEYDSRGFLAKVSNPEGQYFTIVSDPNGRITSVTDSSGRVVSYQYDINGNLISDTDPVNRVTSYGYGDQGFMTSVTSPGSRTVAIEYQDLRASKVTSPDGSFSTFEYNLGQKTTILTDPKGVKQVYKFDDSWNLENFSNPGTPNSKEFDFDGSFVTGYRNAAGTTRTYGYDANGLLTSIKDSFGSEWKYEYHPKFRKLTKKIDPLGRVWSYTWCAKGNLISAINPIGGRSTFKYDQWNNLISQTDPLGRTERDEYDPGGSRILRHINAVGGVSSFTYDARGNLLSVCDPLGRKVTFQYDLRDRLVKTIYPDNSFVTEEYDFEGRVAARIDNSGRRTEFHYDSNGRLLTLKAPGGAVLSRE